MISALLTLSALCLAAPVVSGVSSKNTYGRVEINYNLTSDSESKVILVVSNDGGKTFNLFPEAVQGDVGCGVSPGDGKEMLWFPGADKIKITNDIRIKVVATNPRAIRIVQIDGGSFSNGVDSVHVSTFLLDQFELTQREYLEVMGSNPSYFRSVANAPVESVSWFDAIEYCNRRSLFEGFTPCYSYAKFGANPATWPEGWNLDFNNHLKISWDRSADGYRLPTEMEWMWAAKGGVLSRGVTYSGSNTVEAVAWYDKNSQARTHTVGTKICSELPLWDMSGNVMEWVWDIHAAYPKGPRTDPTGPAKGDKRVLRSGSYNRPALYSEVTHRESENPTIIADHIGFRVCRNLNPDMILVR